MLMLNFNMLQTASIVESHTYFSTYIWLPRHPCLILAGGHCSPSSTRAEQMRRSCGLTTGLFWDLWLSTRRANHHKSFLPPVSHAWGFWNDDFQLQQW